MRKSEFIAGFGSVVGIVIIIAVVACFFYVKPVLGTAENNSQPPNLYYTTPTSSAWPVKAVLGTNSWGTINNDDTGLFIFADYPAPLEQNINDSLAVAGSDSILLSIGYDNTSLTLPNVKNIEVDLWDTATDTSTAITSGTAINNFSFNAPDQAGEYIYTVWVNYDQGSVSYALKVEVSQPTIN